MTERRRLRFEARYEVKCTEAMRVFIEEQTDRAASRNMSDVLRQIVQFAIDKGFVAR